MKIAIISVSKKGYELSLSLKEKLDLDSTIIKTDLYHKNVKKYFPILFYEYDAIIPGTIKSNNCYLITIRKL